ncbi:MAG: DUF1015 family protein [Actinobacteria bacterium]|nr:DUF1015 family protein [Actinomycetota bacterium]
MTSLHPYRGWLVSPTAADRVVAPAYDSLSPAERGAVAAAQPDSFLNVMRSPEDQPPGAALDREELLAASRATLDRLLAEGAFDRSARPAYQVLRMRRGEHVQTGVVGTVPVDDIGPVVRLHEETREDKEDDLVRHLEVVGVESSPVGLVHRGPSPVADLLARVTERAPDLTVTAEDGLEQQVWTVAAEDDTAAIERAFRDVPALYLTDGHHRAAAAVRYARRAGVQDGDAPPARLLVVVFPAAELRLEPYHRVVRGVGADRADAVLAALAERFTVTPVVVPGVPDPPDAAGAFLLHLADRWHRIRSAAPGAAADPVTALDVTVLQERILGPVLGIADPRTDERLEFVPGTRGLEELVRRAGDDGAAFALAPTDVTELMAVADAGAVMPPKSTWFEPKLRSGMFLYGVGPDWHGHDVVG